jgi:hypothetical protein
VRVCKESPCLVVEIFIIIGKLVIKKQNHSFSFVEGFIVVAVIGILATIAGAISPKW